MLELFDNYPKLDFTQPQNCSICGELILKSYLGRIHILQASLESIRCFKAVLGYDPKEIIDTIREQTKVKQPMHSPNLSNYWNKYFKRTA